MSVIGPSMEQVEYRLQDGAGCGAHRDDGQAQGTPQQPHEQPTYRLADERGLMWIGQGLHEFGIIPRTPLTPDQYATARALMNGVHPWSGKVLVPAKHEVDPRAKLPAAPLLAALEAAAAEQGTTVQERLSDRPAVARRVARMARGIARQGEAHLMTVTEIEQVARAAGVDVGEAYTADELAVARRWCKSRVRVGNRGYDLTLDVTKSLSVLYGLAGREFAAELETVFADAVVETVGAVEGWAAYGLRGHQGDGQVADREESTGLLGWVMWHRTARPVDGAAPDPHLHAHVTIANMVRGRGDGRWSAIASGGRDIHRHAHAADALLKARIRRVLTERYGISWIRDPHTGAWEIASIPEQVRVLFSKRDGQVKALLARLGKPYDEASRQARKVASAESRQRKQDDTDEVDLRADWRRQLAAEGIDADTLVRTCRQGGELPPRPSAEQIAAWIWRAGGGLTAHRKVVTRADVLAAVIDALPDGVAGVAEAEALTDEVLRHAPAVELPESGASHLSNAERFTSRDVLEAENAILASVRSRYDSGVAVLDAETVRMAIDAFEVGNAVELSGEQRAAVERVLMTGHGVEAITGVAGAGKTTLMAAVKTAFEVRGLVVRGAATAAVAAANLSAESGIASHTIAGWLRRIRDPDRRGLRGVDVLVVDEAAMVDDRELAALLREAERRGTKVVLVGDPLQLRAVGVGGGFGAVHRQIRGLTLRHNRRQRDPLERKALELWRAHQRGEALHVWSQGDRVRSGRGADDTMARLIADWADARQPYRTGDREAVYDELADVLVLAGTNEAVERLNLTSRALRRELGEITGPERTYRIAGGRSIALAVGDHVRVRRNDYRARRGEGELNVLNGYRGRVVAIDVRDRVQVEWRQAGPDGPTLATEWISRRFIAEGGLSYGTAMTVAAAQGLTAEHALIYGMGLDPHTLYSAMARDRATARLYLPLELLETDADRARHGEVRGKDQELQRAMAAYAATLEGDRSDKLLSPEPEPVAPRKAGGREPGISREREADREVSRDDDVPARAGDGPPRDAEREALVAVRRAAAALSLVQSQYGVGLLAESELEARLDELDRQIAVAEAEIRAAERDRRRFAEAGGGPVESRLIAKRDRLAEQVRRIEAASSAAERLHQALAAVADGRRFDELRQREHDLAGELGTLRPWQRARRRELETELAGVAEQRTQHRRDVLAERMPELRQAAQEAAEQAPPEVTWPLVRRRNADLHRDFTAAQRGARAQDVSDAGRRAQAARGDRVLSRREHAAVEQEVARRRALSPERRSVEDAVRIKHSVQARTGGNADQPRVGPVEREEMEKSRSPREEASRDRGHDM
ncbi:MobF family relaxase [Nonomuraea harbinensis]|uniref:MobF family relaxase n=1 Tax=Nonomuraea harbinensis TaxID=1286938 RepID=A0ABW1C5R7_9ACTN|nr:MobF family relaxase [Nonomuraea harbinensis]